MCWASPTFADIFDAIASSFCLHTNVDLPACSSESSHRAPRMRAPSSFSSQDGIGAGRVWNSASSNTRCWIGLYEFWVGPASRRDQPGSQKRGCGSSLGSLNSAPGARFSALDWRAGRSLRRRGGCADERALLSLLRDDGAGTELSRIDSPTSAGERPGRRNCFAARPSRIVVRESLVPTNGL